MTTITASSSTQRPGLRSLNILRDLPTVADLIELCFGETMDIDGQRYLQQLRHAGRDNAFLRWASTAMDTVSVPLSGYVWEEGGEIVGNVSLIPFREAGKQVYMIANVAVHPDFRRRGIARALTVAAMQHALRRQGCEMWLHVRDDNPGVLALYANLGFKERARRTTWVASPKPPPPQGIGKDFTITKRAGRDWPLVRDWLRHSYPEELDWYLVVPWEALRPGFLPALYRFFASYEIRERAVYRDGELQAALVWQTLGGRVDRLWAAAVLPGSQEALETLLLYARSTLVWRHSMNLDYPASESADAILRAGFQARRTLIWMRYDASLNSQTRI